MKTCGALLVLLCCSLAQLRGETISENDITHQGLHTGAESRENEVLGAAERTEATDTASTQQTCQPDIYTVLRETAALVSELKVELRNTKTEMETRLRASEKAVEELRREREERKVSFSASLRASGDGHTGPFNSDTTLVYRHIFTNIGNAYNPNTGIFTAPVRGVYVFTYRAFADGHASIPTAVDLYKNSQRIVVAYGAGNIHHVGASNGASLQLEVGDVVYLRLRANARVRDTPAHHTTFTGYLLFTM